MEQKTRIERKFIEGQGWQISEVPIDTPEGQGAFEVKRGTAAPPTPVVLALSSVPLQKLIDEIAQRGQVVIEADEHRELQERIHELERMLDHSASGGTLPEEQPPLPPKGKGKAKQPDAPADIAAAIVAAADLDQLTELMKDVRDKKMLALADERAEQIKAGGQE